MYLKILSAKCRPFCSGLNVLTHWGRVTHICVGKLIIIGSDNGLSPDRRQAIIWTNAGSMSIGPMRTYFSENLIKIQQFSLKKLHLKMSSAKWRPSCLGLNVLIFECSPSNKFRRKLYQNSVLSPVLKSHACLGLRYVKKNSRWHKHDEYDYIKADVEGFVFSTNIVWRKQTFQRKRWNLSWKT